MPAPLVGAAITAAARLAAKKLAQQGAKKVAKTATSRARSNSAAASKIAAPKSSIAKRQQMIAAQEKLSPKEIVKTNPQFQGKIKSVLPSRVLGGRSVKVVKPSSATNRAASNAANKPPSKADAKWSMEKAKLSARKGETVKIKSGGNIKPAFPKKAKGMSYSQLKDMPNLVKIDSAKGNTVKKIAYRKRTSN